jgi:hypothetical protein
MRHRDRGRSLGLELGGGLRRVAAPMSHQPNGRSVDDEHQQNRYDEGHDCRQIDHADSGGMMYSIMSYNERRGRNSREVRWIFAR